MADVKLEYIEHSTLNTQHSTPNVQFQEAARTSTECQESDVIGYSLVTLRFGFQNAEPKKINPQRLMPAM
jgi:hypothetical protein